MKITCTNMTVKDVYKDEIWSVEATLEIKKWFGLVTVIEQYYCDFPEDFYHCWINKESKDILSRNDKRYRVLNNAFLQIDYTKL